MPTVYYCEWNKWHTKVLLLSYFFLTGNDSGVMGFFFQENSDQSVEVSAEINGSLIFGILGLF